MAKQATTNHAPRVRALLDKAHRELGGPVVRANHTLVLLMPDLGDGIGTMSYSARRAGDPFLLAMADRGAELNAQAEADAMQRALSYKYITHEALERIERITVSPADWGCATSATPRRPETDKPPAPSDPAKAQAAALDEVLRLSRLTERRTRELSAQPTAPSFGLIRCKP